MKLALKGSRPQINNFQFLKNLHFQIVNVFLFLTSFHLVHQTRNTSILMSLPSTSDNKHNFLPLKLTLNYKYIKFNFINSTTHIRFNCSTTTTSNYKTHGVELFYHHLSCEEKRTAEQWRHVDTSAISFPNTQTFFLKPSFLPPGPTIWPYTATTVLHSSGTRPLSYYTTSPPG